MDLPINDLELSSIIESLPSSNLRRKLQLVQEVRDEYPNGPYKKILREEHGMVI
jgi:hypothetical protein|tara:strand:+ start:292 stop:453 length:162 start_codon:yes stop_codon:yes gene_type:complete